MSSTQPPPQRYSRLRGGIDAFFEWLSIVVILALFLSSIIIVLQLLPGGTTFTIAGFPVGMYLSYLAQGIMMISVEAAMLGCSTVAKRAKRAGDDAMSTKYMWYGILFLLLFIVTLIFQVLHVPPWADMILLMARCAAGGCYAYFCHGDNHEGLTNALTPQQANEIQTLTEQVNTLLTQVNKQAENHSLFIDQVNAQFQKVNDTLARVNDQVNESLAKVNARVNDLHSPDVSGEADEHFNRLAKVVYELSSSVREIKVSVTEVHSQISQVQQLPAPAPTAIESDGVLALEPPEVPVLIVPGVSQERVMQVLEARLKRGKPWGKISGNYDITKRIKEAYEAYCAQVNAGERSIHLVNAVNE